MVAAIGYQFRFFSVLFPHIVLNALIVGYHRICILHSHLFRKFQESFGIFPPFFTTMLQTIYIDYQPLLRKQPVYRKKATTGNAQYQNHIALLRCLYQRYYIIQDALASIGI